MLSGEALRVREKALPSDRQTVLESKRTGLGNGTADTTRDDFFRSWPDTMHGELDGIQHVE